MLSSRLFQSTRPARGATACQHRAVVHELISIHAPREGRDFDPRRRAGEAAISIHAPREGRDSFVKDKIMLDNNFNPRAPRGARLRGVLLLFHAVIISIHAPREGRDRCPIARALLLHYISIHAPREGRDLQNDKFPQICGISIHAPREGRDWWRRPPKGSNRNFNPRAPRGARQQIIGCDFNVAGFQSTRPARGATSTPARILSARCHFNPRAPRGARQPVCLPREPSDEISIHAPREGRDTSL